MERDFVTSRIFGTLINKISNQILFFYNKKKNLIQRTHLFSNVTMIFLLIKSSQNRKLELSYN
jgi:hypothetical protein